MNLRNATLASSVLLFLAAVLLFVNARMNTGVRAAAPQQAAPAAAPSEGISSAAQIAAQAELDKHRS